eukprot:9297449-Pyramimonas_sp.AAC.1
MGTRSRARSGATDRWADSKNDFWNNAACNSTALRAALQRAVMDEAAHKLRFAVAVLLLDLKKYGNVSLLKLMQGALSQGYPSVVALLEIH